MGKYPMELRRNASRKVARFHEGWIKFLLNSSVQTLKRVCLELCREEDATYRDGVIFSRLRENLEFVIRDLTKSRWVGGSISNGFERPHSRSWPKPCPCPAPIREFANPLC